MLRAFEPAGDDASRLIVEVEGAAVTVHLPLPGLYNAYNAVAALCIARSRGLPLTEAADALAHVTAPFGRVEQVEWHGRRLQLLLVKNPTGFNQIIQTFLSRAQRDRV